MATIGALNVSLSLATQAFNKGVERAQVGLGKLAKAAKVASLAVAGITLSAGGAFAILAKFVDSQASAIAGTVRLADQLDIGTDALIGLQHAAQQVHVSNEELNAGLVALNQTFGQVEAGSAFMATTFRALGLSGARLAQLPLDQAFFKIADALNAVSAPSQKAALAYQLFGDRAKTILPVLNQGSALLGEQRKQAELLGKAVGRDGAQNLLEAQRAFQNLKDAFSGIFTTLAVKLAPVVTVISDKIVKFLTEGPGLAARLANFIDKIVETIPYLAEVLQDASVRLIDFGKTLLAVLQKSVVGWLRLAKALEGPKGRTPGIVEQAANPLGAAFADFFKEKSGGRRISDDLLVLSKALGEAQLGLARLSFGVKRSSLGSFFRDAFKDAGKFIRELAEESKRLQQEGEKPITRFADSYKKLPGIFAATQTPFEKFRDNLDEIFFLLKNTTGYTGALNREIARQAVQLEATLGVAQARLPRALRAGTAEALTAITRFEAQQRRSTEDPQERIARILAEAREYQRVQTKLQSDIAAVVKGLNDQITVDGAQ